VVQLNFDAAGVVTRRDSPWNNLSDMLDHVRANPGAAKISGTATGGVWDLARAGLLLEAGLPVDAMLWVPAQGSAPAIVELLGGHIDAVCCSVAEAAQQLEAGELKLLGVMGAERHENFPDVSTATEQGYDWEMGAWRGLMVPAGTPRPIVDRLYEAGRQIAESEAFQEFMQKNGFSIKVRGPDEFAAYLGSNDDAWRQVIVEAGYAQE
jgi:tripartite-type tricarboxylate transporter receptor subunit TctC